MKKMTQAQGFKAAAKLQRDLYDARTRKDAEAVAELEKAIEARAE